MGPVEIAFFIWILIMGVVGIVRGYTRELGVTLLLLVGLFVLLFIDSQFPTTIDAALTGIAGSAAADKLAARAVMYSLFLLVVAFISYQGNTLVFPGTGNNPLLGFLVGLLNGYLLAGSIWYYQAQAGWPFLNIQAPFTAVYTAMMRILPPAILDWRFVIALVVVMLLLRVWK